MSIPAPLKLHKGLIVPEWIDYNGHMNVAYYVLVFDRATDDFFDFMGLTAEYRAAGNVPLPSLRKCTSIISVR